MEKRASDLLGKLEVLKIENRHQSEVIGGLKCQINQKEREINRLHQAFKEEPVMCSMSQRCSSCSEKDEKIKFLEEKLEVAVMKQHEAMSRALHLADKNQRLERELKDIDNLALAVEEDCQTKVKQNLKSIDILEEKLRHKKEDIKNLESTIKDMKNIIEQNRCELENLRAEKKIFEKNLNVVNSEKKLLTEKVNRFLLIEQNLTSEISNLQEINKRLQRQIGEMEDRIMNVLGTGCKGRLEGKRKKEVPSTGFSTLGGKTSKILKCHCDGLSFGDYSQKKSSVDLTNKISQERDFKHCECHRLREVLAHIDSRFDNSADIVRELQTQEREIQSLKQETHVLRHENCALLKKFDCGDHSSCSSGDSIKIILDRLEKERDMALSDILRLQGERDALREKIKAGVDLQKAEQARFERIIIENEDRIRRLESDRRDLISNQTSQRIGLSNAEEKCDEYKEQARSAQTELAEMTANYNQLKALQEHTDRTLLDVQARLSQTVMELRFSTNKIKDLEKEKEDLKNEISVLKKEKCSLKSSLVCMEKEKDSLLMDLDEKTERLAKIENELKKKETYILELSENFSQLEKKFEFTLTEKTNREHGLRTLERVVGQLKEELQESERQKEALARENRRLQDDLATVAKDCITARRDLDTEKQEVENLKRQLQQYVSEVKRAEELLTKKEAERNQMLEHFRSLSLEANALETNNHTLESTVENAKSELTTANNKILDLEQQISSRDSLLCSYENQMAELTTQIAELESKLKQQMDQKNRAEADSVALRDLCSAIDGQKESFRRQANGHDAEKTQLMNEVRRLSEEYEDLNQKLSHERNISQSLEKSLSHSRQETLEHKITNKDLQAHVQHLRQKVDELNQKLEVESQDVRRYQAQCAELSQQVSELRREVTNARFELAKATEDSRRNFPQSFHDVEEVREIRFEADILRSSARNIPPLTFPEDSDRTVSFDSDREFLKICSEEPGAAFRNFGWRLSPLPEKSGSDISKADTTSDLSSLPEDSECRNGMGRVTTSASDERFPDFSARPTYSVHGNSDPPSKACGGWELAEREARSDPARECEEDKTFGAGPEKISEEERQKVAFAEFAPSSSSRLEPFGSNKNHE